MHRACIAMVFLASTALVYRAKGQEPASGEQFLIRGPTGRISILGADGMVLEEIENSSSIADFSPNGEWLAYSEPNLKTNRARLVIRSRSRPEKHFDVPLVWGMTGTSCRLLWAGDSKSLLIAEMGWNEMNKNLTAYRVYDLDRENVIELNVPPQYWPSDWSAPEQRLLVTVREEEHANSLAWINVDGSGDPEYLSLTGENEAAWDFRVAPDGLRILCQIGPKGPPWDSTQGRLTVVDLAKGNRVQVDEPGQTYGCCWSPNGARIAYTWQPLLDHPEQVNEREIQFVTCDPDGSNRKVVTKRKFTISPTSSEKSGYPVFFSVLDWR